MVDGLRALGDEVGESLDLPDTVEVTRAESPLVTSLASNYGPASDRDFRNLARWLMQADRAASMRLGAG
jgi:hypothetical protein